MSFLVAAKVWHYWISIALFGGIVLALGALAVGYLVKVTSNRFPKQ